MSIAVRQGRERWKEGHSILPEYLLGFTIAFFIGILASILGVGGGTLFVPSLSLIFGLDPKIAIGTSLAIIVFTSLSGTVTYGRQGRIFYKSAIFIILPSVAGSIIGSLSTAYIPGSVLALIFALLSVSIPIHFAMVTSTLVIFLPHYLVLWCIPGSGRSISIISSFTRLGRWSGPLQEQILHHGSDRSTWPRCLAFSFS